MTMIVIWRLMWMVEFQSTSDNEELCNRAACEQQILQNSTKSNVTRRDSVKMLSFHPAVT